jgi:hypothetical protein
MGGFAGLNNIITFANFRFVGQYSSGIVAFKMHNSIFNPWGASSCTISAVMLSGPGACVGEGVC